MKEIYQEMKEREKTGCSFGQVSRQMLIDGLRRVNDVETKFWAIILLLVSNLAGIVFLFVKG